MSDQQQSLSLFTKEEKEDIVKLTLEAVLIRLNNEVLQQTGHELSVKYQDIILTTKVY